LVLRRARIEEFSAMAPVVCVAVSQRLGRSFMDNGSPAETYPACEIDRYSAVNTTAEVALNNYV
jgi:hypothetical protein